MGDESTSQVMVVLTTAPGPDEARRLARALVEERHAACANVVPSVTSVYWWEGGVQEEGEALTILKTTASQVDALEARLVELHPYEVPEVVALPVQGGHAPYLDWVRGEVGRSP